MKSAHRLLATTITTLLLSSACSAGNDGTNNQAIAENIQVPAHVEVQAAEDDKLILGQAPAAVEAVPAVAGEQKPQAKKAVPAPSSKIATPAADPAPASDAEPAADPHAGHDMNHM